MNLGKFLDEEEPEYHDGLQDEDEDDTDAVDGAEEESFSDCGKHNKTLLLALLIAADSAIQEAFEVTTNQLSTQGADVGKLAALQSNCKGQLQQYREMIAAMDTGQFHQSGSLQVRKLILTWQNDLLQNLEALASNG